MANLIILLFSKMNNIRRIYSKKLHNPLFRYKVVNKVHFFIHQKSIEKVQKQN